MQTREGLQELQENSALSPVGTSESSPGRSPGFNEKQSGQSRKGRLNTGLSFQPSLRDLPDERIPGFGNWWCGMESGFARALARMSTKGNRRPSPAAYADLKVVSRLVLFSRFARGLSGPQRGNDRVFLSHVRGRSEQRLKRVGRGTPYQLSL